MINMIQYMYSKLGESLEKAYCKILEGGVSYYFTTKYFCSRANNGLVVFRQRQLGNAFWKVSRKLVSICTKESDTSLF